MCIVLTDGIQTKEKGSFTALFEASQPLKDKGVNIYSIGVGQDTDLLELNEIASSPDNVFAVENFDHLSREVKRITKLQCRGKSIYY